jgi:alkylation response protein AidB-like acyl-CoA dehydrogenase
MARRFADEVLAPAAMEVELTGQIPAAQFDGLAAQGFYGLAGPVEAGGLDVDFPTACRVIEVMASGCLSTAFVWLQHHGTVRAVAGSGDARLKDKWLRALCEGKRRAGVALAGTIPGPPMLRARAVTGGYVFDGFSPWVTGWGHIDTLHTAARDDDDNVIWALLDVEPTDTAPTDTAPTDTAPTDIAPTDIAPTGAGPDGAISVEPLDLIAVMASRTVQANLHSCFVSSDRVTHSMPLSRWRELDAQGLRTNGSLALGLAARCCALLGASPLDDELDLVRQALDAGTVATMPPARAGASELALRAAGALVAVKGSRSILTNSDPQRLAREALFLLVFASRPAIKESLVDLLTARSAR